MRIPIAVWTAVLAVVPVWAQDKADSPKTETTAPIVSDRCAPLGEKLSRTEPLLAPRLFIRYDKDWQEITPSFIGTDFTLDKYSGDRIYFLYVVPASESRNRQFLSVRSIADTAREETFVNLRRQHHQFDMIHSGLYEGYHVNGDPSAMLRRFHRWPGGDESDKPDSAKKSWSFQTTQELVRRRVLSIPFRAMDRIVCVPFVIGPNIATPVEETEGGDEITVLKGFVVEITEAKTASGHGGRTYKIRSPVTKVQ